MIFQTNPIGYIKHMFNKVGDFMQVDEKKAYLKVKLRNLKRKYARIKEVPSLTETAIELKSEIDAIERELQYD